MNAGLVSNRDVFRAFLKDRLDSKKRVTAVTAVTSVTLTKSNTYQLQSLVTFVTDVVTSVRECSGVSEADERQAFAEVDGHVSPVFSLAFAAIQMGCPNGRADQNWRTAIDDAGRFLDSHGHEAATLGWQASDIFNAAGLAWALRNASVTTLTRTTATFTDGRSFIRSE